MHFSADAPAVPATRLSLADESRGCTRVGCCCAMRQAGGRLWREIREVPLLRYVFAVSESDELTNYSNQGTKLSDQFIRISVEIAANAPRFGIRKAGRTLAFENCSLNMLIGTYVSSLKQPEMQRRCTARYGVAREGACCGRPSRRCTLRISKL
jgi:hypothetical protein